MTLGPSATGVGPCAGVGSAVGREANAPTAASKSLPPSGAACGAAEEW